MSDISPLLNNSSGFLPPTPGAGLPSVPKDMCLNPHGSHRNRVNQDSVATACQDFEAIFVSYLLKTMRESVPKGGWLDEGSEVDFYQGLMDWEIATQASRQDQFGLWKTMYRQITGHEPARMTPDQGENLSVEPSVSNQVSGGPHEVRVEGITDHPIRRAGSSPAAVPTPEDSGGYDTP
jgi:flagellar protein FlgJ